MAALIPFFSAIGTAGGTAAAAVGTAASSMGTLSTISAIAGIASAGMSVIGGQQQQAQAQYQARIAELQGRQQAIAVTDELIQTMAMNNASAAASGLQSTGSVEEAQKQNIIKASEELSINTLNTAQRVASFKQQGKNAMYGGISNALSTGAGVLGNVYQQRQIVKKTGQ